MYFRAISCIRFTATALFSLTVVISSTVSAKARVAELADGGNIALLEKRDVDKRVAARCRCVRARALEPRSPGLQAPRAFLGFPTASKVIILGLQP